MKILLLPGVFLVVGLVCPVFSARLQTTPIEDKGTYRLENQEDGSFLYASDPAPNGKVTAGEYSGHAGQKWVFTADPSAGKDVYTIVPLANENNSVSVNQKYLLIKVGHGKRLIQNVQSKLCIQGYGRGRAVREEQCGKDNPKQRWNAQPVSA